MNQSSLIHEKFSLRKKRIELQKRLNDASAEASRKEMDARNNMRF